MSRSLKKGPYINVKLEKKVLAMNESGKKAIMQLLRCLLAKPERFLLLVRLQLVV